MDNLNYLVPYNAIIILKQSSQFLGAKQIGKNLGLRRRSHLFYSIFKFLRVKLNNFQLKRQHFIKKQIQSVEDTEFKLNSHNLNYLSRYFFLKQMSKLKLQKGKKKKAKFALKTKLFSKFNRKFY